VARPYDRPATLVALVNAIVVMLLPVAAVGAIALFANDSRNTSATVRGSLPASERYAQLAQIIVWYVLALSPFAMAAAWRTFVHAKLWLAQQEAGWRGVLEAGACGFVAAVVVLLPGIVTRPMEAPPYVLAYGGMCLILGLAVGLILWTTATVTLHLLPGGDP
jgi:hypothetical protein